MACMGLQLIAKHLMNRRFISSYAFNKPLRFHKEKPNCRARIKMEFETVIGLESTRRIKTESKCSPPSPAHFCWQNQYNTNVIDWGYPSIALINDKL